MKIKPVNAQAVASRMIVFFVGVAIMIPKDMIFAGMTLAESLEARGILLILKPILAVPYGWIRMPLLETYGTTGRRRLAIDSSCYAAVHTLAYLGILLWLDKPERMVMIGTLVTLITSLLIGGPVGIIIDWGTKVLGKLRRKPRVIQFVAEPRRVLDPAK